MWGGCRKVDKRSDWWGVSGSFIDSSQWRSKAEQSVLSHWFPIYKNFHVYHGSVWLSSHCKKFVDSREVSHDNLDYVLDTRPYVQGCSCTTGIPEKLEWGALHSAKWPMVVWLEKIRYLKPYDSRFRHWHLHPLASCLRRDEDYRVSCEATDYL